MTVADFLSKESKKTLKMNTLIYINGIFAVFSS